jgi:hypothetical protein
MQVLLRRAVKASVSKHLSSPFRAEIPVARVLPCGSKELRQALQEALRLGGSGRGGNPSTCLRLLTFEQTCVAVPMAHPEAAKMVPGRADRKSSA